VGLPDPRLGTVPVAAVELQHGETQPPTPDTLIAWLRERLVAYQVPVEVKIVGGLPRINIVHDSVVTPWEQKGLVMRTLVERIKDREMVLVDGVKILHEDGWALVLPDPEEPITHIWAEAGSEAEARSLSQEYARRIRQMLR